jgi:hypothetical protein
LDSTVYKDHFVYNFGLKHAKIFDIWWLAACNLWCLFSL